MESPRFLRTLHLVRCSSEWCYCLWPFCLDACKYLRLENAKEGCCWREWIFRHVFFVLLMILSRFNYILSTCTYHVHTWKQEIDTTSLGQGVPGSVARSSRHGRTLVGACSRCVIGFGSLYEEPQIDVAMGYTMGCYPKHILCVYIVCIHKYIYTHCMIWRSTYSMTL